MTLLNIISHLVAFLLGGGVVMAYLHKHVAKAVSAANTGAQIVSDVKAAVAGVEKKV